MLGLVVAGGPMVLHRTGHHFVLDGGVVMNLLDLESECFVQCKYVIKGRRFGGHRFGPVGHRPECLVDQGNDIDGFSSVWMFSVAITSPLRRFELLSARPPVVLGGRDSPNRAAIRSLWG